MPWMLQGDKEIPVYKIGEQLEVKAIRITEGKVSDLLNDNLQLIDLSTGLLD